MDIVTRIAIVLDGMKAELLQDAIGCRILGSDFIGDKVTHYEYKCVKPSCDKGPKRKREGGLRIQI